MFSYHKKEEDQDQSYFITTHRLHLHASIKPHFLRTLARPFSRFLRDSFPFTTSCSQEHNQREGSSCEEQTVAEFSTMDERWEMSVVQAHQFMQDWVKWSEKSFTIILLILQTICILSTCRKQKTSRNLSLCTVSFSTKKIGQKIFLNKVSVRIFYFLYFPTLLRGRNLTTSLNIRRWIEIVMENGKRYTWSWFLVFRWISRRSNNATKLSKSNWSCDCFFRRSYIHQRCNPSC